MKKPRCKRYTQTDIRNQDLYDEYLALKKELNYVGDQGGIGNLTAQLTKKNFFTLLCEKYKRRLHWKTVYVIITNMEKKLANERKGHH